MGDVFLLGAGFSKAVSDSMPLLEELSGEIQKHKDLPKPLLGLGNNVELWMTYLSQPHPWLSEAENLRNKALFLELSQLIGEILNNGTLAALQQGCPDWLRTLVNWWHVNKAGILTLNYDTLIERAAGLVLSLINASRFYAVRLTDFRIRDALYSGEVEVETFKLFKLHGSVSWYYSGAASYFGETIYCSRIAPWAQISDDETRSMEDLGDKVPLIVPPTTEKVTYFQHETIRRTWALAGEALRSASRLVCIGYSFPLTDLSIRFFVNGNRPEQKIPLIIVNPDQKAEARYKDLVGSIYEVQHTFTGPDAVRKFVDTLESE